MAESSNHLKHQKNKILASDLERLNFIRVYKKDYIIYLLASVPDLSGKSFTDPDGSKAYSSELRLLKISPTGEFVNIVIDTFFPLLSAPHNSGGMYIDGTKIHVFVNSKESNATYAMSGYSYFVDLESMAVTNKSQLFSNANWGWFPVIQQDGRVSHFSFAGYYSYLGVSIT
ncbi:hypothetical protein [Thiosulfativibrio zosterae]|uniref:Uncharacterized protein n=1 Tax=Thiosulfativibrio zosterae TaxID=2675053 RepID=A0A6F8PR71_9GAMM|nr:hypothetical protein [Thiosulfativibrio zosterae]BBP44527.1 hypothetical protein THMIRHAT_22730 [Thiosulfativibrio zosterae]